MTDVTINDPSTRPVRNKLYWSTFRSLIGERAKCRVTHRSPAWVVNVNIEYPCTWIAWIPVNVNWGTLREACLYWIGFELLVEVQHLNALGISLRIWSSRDGRWTRICKNCKSPIKTCHLRRKVISNIQLTHKVSGERNAC